MESKKYKVERYKKLKNFILMVIYIIITIINKTAESSEITSEITTDVITRSEENDNNNTMDLHDKIKEELSTEDKLMKERYLSQQRSFQYPSPFTTSSYEQYIDSNKNNNWSLNKENNNQVTAKLMTDQSQADFPRFPGSSSNTNGISEYETYGSEEYYSHQPPHDHSYFPPPIMMKQPMMVPQKSMINNLFSTDFIKILLLVILKLLLIKLKTIGFIKIILLILLKLPVIFFGIIFKLLLFVKITNLFKILTLPIFLPLILLILAPLLLLLLPLLLIPFAPLLLIPLLLPLLLFLPIPVLTVTTTTTTTTTTAAPAGKRRRRRFISNEYNNNNLPYQYNYNRNNELQFFRNLIESEKCLERIACKLAADRRSTLFNSYILRILDFAKEYLINPRLYSYAHAYRSGVSSDSTFSTCTNKYPCSRLKS